MRLVNLFLFK